MLNWRISLNRIIEIFELSFYFSNSQIDFSNRIESIPISILNLISDIFNLIWLG